MEVFPIVRKGLLGYLASIPAIARQVREYRPSVVHAHYSLCGVVSSLATRIPVITSLMGSDVIQSSIIRKVLGLLIRLMWAVTIVKSEESKNCLGLKKIHVIPNGVNLDMFIPMDMHLCRRKLEWSSERKHILFVSHSDATRAEKNLSLARRAIENLGREDIELHVISKVPPQDIPMYLNAADMLLLTSNWEGSPNIVKEAMACNVPVVSTDVGDVRWLFGQAEGYCITRHEVSDINQKILECLDYNKQSEGRERIISLQLDSESIAHKLIMLYNQVITK